MDELKSISRFLIIPINILTVNPLFCFILVFFQSSDRQDEFSKEDQEQIC